MGLAAAFDLFRFWAFHDYPSIEICQSFENCYEACMNTQGYDFLFVVILL